MLDFVENVRSMLIVTIVIFADVMHLLINP